MSRSSLRSMMALLRGLSHRWLGARPGGPGTQPFVLCLLLLLSVAVAAVPAWAVISPAAGSPWIGAWVEAAFQSSKETPGVIAGAKWGDVDTKYSCCVVNCVWSQPVNDLHANDSLNQRSFASSTWKQNPCEEAPGDAAGIRWDYVAGDAETFNGFSNCGTDRTCNPPVNGGDSRNNLVPQALASTAWKQNPCEEAPGDTAGIRWDHINGDAEIFNNFYKCEIYNTWTSDAGSCNLMPQARLVSTMWWKQSPCEEAPGNVAGIRWDYVNVNDECGAARTYNNPTNDCDTCNGAQKRLAPMEWKQNPLKEASGGAAGIRRGSRHGRDILDLCPFPILYSDYLTAGSAIGANPSMSTPTISSALHQRQVLRRMICPHPLTRAAVTLSNRKWRPLETS